MERSSLTIADPLATDQWTLWLPTAVTLATLSMEGAPGLVRVMGLGVDQLQLVQVNDYAPLRATVTVYIYSGGSLIVHWVHEKHTPYSCHLPLSANSPTLFPGNRDSLL